MDAEKLANEARNAISDYCFNECKAYCCRKGYILLTKEEADLLTHNKTEELIEKDEIKKEKPNKKLVSQIKTEIFYEQEKNSKIQA